MTDSDDTTRDTHHSRPPIGNTDDVGAVVIGLYVLLAVAVSMIGTVL